ncbi:hypothetical protein BH23ACT1_BH23ACT1_02190 [soil metagenome]
MSRTTVALLAMAATVIGACGVGPERAETSSDTVREEPLDSASEGTATGAEGAPTTTGAAADPPRQEVGGAQGEVLASAEAELAESPGAATVIPVRLDIVSMERLPGELLEARFTITNVGDGPEFSPFASFTRGTGYDVSGAAILDLQGGFRYEVLEDSGGNCLCSVIPIPTRLASGGSATYYARFGAPPEGTSEVDFELPGFPPVAVPL